MYTKTEKAHYTGWGVHLLIGPFATVQKMKSRGILLARNNLLESPQTKTSFQFISMF